jgi:hypothetical protein
MTGGRFTVIVIAVAAVAIVAVLVTSGGINLSGDDSDGGGDRVASTAEQTREQESQRGGSEREERPESEPRRREGHAKNQPRQEIEVPENPDDVRGTAPYALTRTANFRRGLAVLERRRRAVEGVFDQLRVAPGRIDTVIVQPDDRRTNIQVRPDLKISFESTHDFPTDPDFRKTGLIGGALDATAPARMLRAIDRVRHGDAKHDVDYLVISRDIIDHRIEVSAFMRMRTPRPRAFLKEPGAELRAIG